MSVTTERETIGRLLVGYSRAEKAQIRTGLEKRFKVIAAFRRLHPSLKGRYQLAHDTRASYMCLEQIKILRHVWPSALNWPVSLVIVFRRDGRTAAARGYNSNSPGNRQYSQFVFDPHDKKGFLNALFRCVGCKLRDFSNRRLLARFHSRSGVWLWKHHLPVGVPSRKSSKVRNVRSK
jgi:hypothetical protein